MGAVANKLTVQDATRIKAAKKLLESGQPHLALEELQKLTKDTWRRVRMDPLIWRAAQTIG